MAIWHYIFGAYGCSAIILISMVLTTYWQNIKLHKNNES